MVVGRREGRLEYNCDATKAAITKFKNITENLIPYNEWNGCKRTCPLFKYITTSGTLPTIT